MTDVRTDRSAVVTGAGSGIGRAIALRLLAGGWRGGAGHTGPAAGRAAASGLGPRGGWVNDLGIAVMGTLPEPDGAAVERRIRANLMAPFRGASEAIRPCVAAGRPGALGNTRSGNGRAGVTTGAAGDAATGGIAAPTRRIAVQHVPLGIRRTALAPRAARTPLVDRVIRDSPVRARAERAMSIQHPLERIGEPHEAAAAAARLPSGGAAFATGQSLAVDGGLTARRYRHGPDAGLLARDRGGAAPAGA